MPAKPKYNPARLEEVRRACEVFGATDAEIARLLGVCERTINNWKIEKPEFREALKRGKDPANARVKESLWKRAQGYDHDEEKAFLNRDGKPVIVTVKKHVPADVKAVELWLTNRDPDNWRVRHEVTGAEGKPLIPYEGNELARRVVAVLDPRFAAKAKSH